YLGLVLLLRISGKQSLAKRSAYGFVVTVALGSVLASALLSQDVALADGLAALAVLLGLQFVLALTGSRFDPVQRMATSQPTLLLKDGKVDEQVLLDERVSIAEIRAAARQHGHASLEDIAAVILESDGSLSVLSRLDGSGSALTDVRGLDSAGRERTGGRG